MRVDDASRILRAALDAREPSPLQRATASIVERLRAQGIATQALAAREPVPDFALPNRTGRIVALQEILQRGPALIAFYLGDWSPECRAYLRTLGELAADTAAYDAAILAISPQRNVSPHAPNGGAPLDLLFDADNRIARLFGLTWQMPLEAAMDYAAHGIDVAALNGTDGWELPLPATYAVGPDWLVRDAFVDADLARRPALADLRKLLIRLCRESPDAT
ncbi:MAG: redoxin domain-containing protein [Alphaproteobacteria bacterium]